MKKIKVALIGAGYIAHYHARGLLAQPGVEIITVCDQNETAAQKFAQKYNITETSPDADKLFDRSDIDAAVICTPNKFHAPYAIAFLQQGKDVFIEKPLAVDSQQGEQIIQTAQKNDRLVMVGHMWRYDTEVNYIKDVVQSGKIGDIVKTKGYGIHENWGPSGWFTQKELAGGGALADMGVHALDTVRYILSDPKPKQVYARIGTHYGDYDVDDSGIIMITWDNGATSLIESGWWHPHADGPEAGTQLFGTKGYASLFPTKLKFSVENHPGEFIAPLPPRQEHCDQIIYTRQMQHFVECIRTRQTPISSAQQGQVVMQIVDGAYESARTNKAVDL